MLKKLCILILLFPLLVKAQTFSGAGGIIPDAGPQTCFPIAVTGIGNINATFGIESVCLNINHPWVSDLEIILKAPDGTEVQLSVQNGGSGVNYIGTCFTANAVTSISTGIAPFTGNYLPQGYLGNVNNGQNANGNWQLCIKDVTLNDVGNLLNWSIKFSNTPAPPPPVCTSTQVAGNTCLDAPLVCNFGGFCGSTSTAYTADTWPALTAAFCSVIENNSFIKFTANASTVAFNVWVTNSLNGLGIQLMVYSGGCGSGPVTVHACNNQIFPTSIGPTLVTATGLVAGNTYYVMIDGYNADVCDYILVATNGTSFLNATPTNPQICPGESVLLTASGGNGNYVWSPNTGLNTTTGANVIASPLVTTNYTVSSAASGNCALNTTVTITVKPKPDLGLDKNIRICTGYSINLQTLFTTTSLTTVWTKGGVLVADPTNVSTAGAYRLIATNVGNCSDTAIVNISLVTKPSLGADKSIGICPGNFVNLNNLYVTGGFSYTWTYNGQPFLRPDSATNGGLYQLVVFSGNYCSDTANVIINIYPKPNLGNDLAIKICDGTPVDVTGIFNTSGLTTQWTLNGVPVLNPTAITTIGDYQLIATNANGCSDTALFSISLSPQVNLGNDTAITICSVNPINLLAIYNTSGYSSNWYLNGALITNPTVINTSGIYKLIAINGFACKDSALLNLTVNQTPSVGPDRFDTICKGVTVNLNSYFNTAGLSNFWTNINSIPVTSPLNIIDSNIYRLIAINSFGCADTAFVKIDAKPSPNLGPDRFVNNCPNVSINLTQQFNTLGLSTFWTFGGTPVANPATINTPGLYRLVALNIYNCYDTAFFNYTIINKPNLGPDKIVDVCIGQTLNLNTQFITNGLITNWSIGGSTITNVTAISNPGIYQLIASNGLTCIDTALLTIKVNPTANLGPDKIVRVCGGQPIDLNSYYITSGLSTSWTFDGTSVLTPNYVLTPGTYQLIASNAFGCTDTALLKLAILTSPAIGPDDTLIVCPGIGIDISGQYNLTNLTGNWTFGGFSIPDSTNVTNPGIYRLIAKNILGCTDTAFLTIQINSNLYLGADINKILCDKGTLDLTSVYFISGLNTSWTLAGAPVLNPNSINVPGIYRIIANNGGACQDTAFVSVFLRPKPSIDRDTATSTCQFKPVNLTSFYNTLGLNSSWTLNNLIVPTPTAVSTPGLYRLVAANAFDCTDTAFVNVVVNPKPVLGNDTNIVVCIDNAINLNSYFDTTNLILQWTLNNTPVSNTTLNNDTGIFKLTANSLAGCSDTAFLTVAHLPKPNLGSDTVIQSCFGQIINLLTTKFDPLATTNNWTKNGIPVIRPDSIATPGIYQLIVSLANGCSDTVLVNISFNPKPNLGADKIAFLCPGSSIGLTAQYNTTGLTTTWLYGGVPVSNPSAVTLTGIYQLIAINNFNCADTADVTVNVSTKPSLGVDKKESICPGTVIDLTNQFNTTSLTVKWIYNSLPVPNPNAVTANGIYQLIGTNATNCSDTAFFSIIYLLKPNIGADVFDTVCKGSYRNLTVPFNTLGLTSSWTLGGIATASPDSVVTSSTYQLVVTNSFGCTDTATASLHVKQPSDTTINYQTCNNKLPVNFNGKNYFVAGIYKDTLLNTVGCDSIITLNLLVKDTSFSLKNDSICINQLPYNWNGNVYNAGGLYSIKFTNSSGCDSVANLLLIVKNTSSSTNTITVCPNQLPYTWNGIICNNAGIYSATLVNSVGCDSIASLTLQVYNKIEVFDTVKICPASFPYNWNGNLLNVPGNYTDTFLNIAGCDSIVLLKLVSKNNSNSIDTIKICPSQLPFSWNGAIYNAAGTYNATLVNADGCDSLATLVLMVKANSISTDTTKICPNQLPYSWNGNTYNTAGTYNVTLVNAAGCDSLATLVLMVKTNSTSTDTIKICPSQLPFNWNGNTYNTAGTYNNTLVNAAGCDSLVTLVLMVKANTTSIDTIKICPSQLPFSWNGTTYTTAGTYNNSFTNAVGCDSLATLVLMVKANSTSIDTIKICPSQIPFSWNGNTYNTAGTYNTTLANAAGCDSLATLELMVKANTTSTDSIKICPNQLPYNWNGNTYNTAGTYNVTLVNAAGCDSLATLVLMVKANSTSTDTIKICPSQLPYNWNGNSYNSAGTYNNTLVNAAGCDSTATLVLIIKANSTSTDTIKICPSQLPYNWNGNSYNSAGTYNNTLVNAAGCDSTATLVLIVKANSTSTDTIKICPSQLPFSWNGNSYNSAGNYNTTFVNAAGCDSVATLVLIVKANSTSTDTIKICPSQLPFSWNGNSYNSAGSYNATLVNAAGCDSLATLVLMVKANTTSTDSIKICPSQLPYSWNGNTYNTAGTYNVTLVNAAGCDSLAALVLMVKANSTSTDTIKICPSQLPYNWNGNSYNTAGTYNTTLVNAAGCDSLATLVLMVKANSTSTDTIKICPSQLPFSWNGNSYNTSGTYNNTLANAAGCDSLATLVLIVNANTTSTDSIKICLSQLPFSWNGNTYNAAGIYNTTLANAAGCDSLATLVLMVKANSSSSDTIKICPSQLPYNWNGNTYNTAGTYNTTLVNSTGCDSLATLVLMVKANSTSTDTIKICPSQLPYNWNGNTCNTAGTYNATLVNAAGCDSLATLVLMVKANSTSTDTIKICPSQLPFSWNGNTYNAAGNYSMTLNNAAGCDSIANLVLVVTNNTSSLTNISLCPNDLPYSWNGKIFNTIGSYTVTLTNASGCDSLALLNISFNSVVTSIDTVIRCTNNLPYLWNGITINTAGNYQVNLKTFRGCDSMAKLYFVTHPTSTTNVEKSVCLNQLPFNWNGTLYNVAGIYSKTFLNQFNCDSTVNLQLTILPIPIKPKLGNDTLICSGDKIILSAENYDSYLWQNNSTASTLVADKEGIYFVQVMDKNNCTNADTIAINLLQNCNDISFPSAFSPNGDGKNDNFGALGNLFLVKDFTLKIFNRFGELVFISNNPYNKWSGDFKGKPSLIGSYIWQCSYLYNNKTKKSKQGSITLLR